MAYTLLAQGNTLHDMKHIQHKLAAYAGYNKHNSVPNTPKLKPLSKHHTAIKMEPEHHHSSPNHHVVEPEPHVVYKSNKKAEHEI